MKKKQKEAAENNWSHDERGYQRTRSEKIIQTTLGKLKQKKRFLTLIQKGYQSANTLLVDYDNRELQIDKPMDWPGTNPSVMVVFRDEARLLSHFTVPILRASQDTLYTGFPSELYQLQRRDQYRVDLPRATKISFVHKEQVHAGFHVHDISASGILIYRKNKELLAWGDMIGNISIQIPPEEFMANGADDQGTLIKVKRGQVIRTFHNRRLLLYFAGIKFLADIKEEEILLKYVRQRELELLRVI